MVKAIATRHWDFVTFYMVWPWKARLFDLDAVIEPYTLAAQSVDGLLFPAGLVWKLAWTENPDFPLYSVDDIHPSSLGSYVAALTIVATLSGRSAVGMPSDFDVDDHYLQFPEAQIPLAQWAAEAAVAASRAAGTARLR